ncbi:MAG: hypothetical protein H6824_21560 [Planctomycetaceae bacterium]|nr:hypothetical protein [Planctomycetaceae bacterium]
MTVDRTLELLKRGWLVHDTRVLSNMPEATPLVRSHRGYRTVFELIRLHFSTFRVQLDDYHLLLQAKSIPLLYEWWCLLEVLHILHKILELKVGGDDRTRPFRRLISDGRDRFVIQFEGNQTIDFVDQTQRLVRVRYEPEYRSIRDSGGLGFGLLGGASLRTPDIAIEIYPDEGGLSVPSLIVVLDAKYSTSDHERKLEIVRGTYSKIGVFSTGQEISRQIWALTPAAASPDVTKPWWASYCTVDNNGFWFENFDMSNTVAGAIQAKPNQPGGRSPLEMLIRLILQRAGVELNDEAKELAQGVR